MNLTQSVRAIHGSTQYKIFKVLEALCNLKHTEVEYNSDYSTIFINSKWIFVPDYKLVWSPNKKHYRVYIKIADTGVDKTLVSHAICVIDSALTAAGFVNVYSFVHKHRANNKTPVNK